MPETEESLCEHERRIVIKRSIEVIEKLLTVILHDYPKARSISEEAETFLDTLKDRYETLLSPQSEAHAEAKKEAAPTRPKAKVQKQRQ
jgi:hypothetical protein